MAIKGTYDAFKQAIQDLIAPQLERISGEIFGLKGEISGLKTEVCSLENVWRRVWDRCAKKCEGQSSLRAELNACWKKRVKGWRTPTNGLMNPLILRSLRERLAALEAKLAARNQLGERAPSSATSEAGMRF
jgi:hypothetical protein